MKDKWTKKDLIDYVSQFKDGSRDDILKSILEGDLLGKFAESSVGRMILNGVADSITENILEILRTSTSDPKEAGKIMHCALKINVAYDFMHKLAIIASESERHEHEMIK